LAEVSVGAVVAVAAEADLPIGGKQLIGI
jgi:hypothetical protein